LKLQAQLNSLKSLNFLHKLLVSRHLRLDTTTSLNFFLQDCYFLFQFFNFIAFKYYFFLRFVINLSEFHVFVLKLHLGSTKFFLHTSYLVLKILIRCSRFLFFPCKFLDIRSVFVKFAFITLHLIFKTGVGLFEIINFCFKVKQFSVNGFISIPISTQLFVLFLEFLVFLF
jgi:hypothetical protein